ncbi:MAG: hypothetical protein ABSA53_24855 [Streptosporangiaceae bacterium]|jgi:hypothetical protein
MNLNAYSDEDDDTERPDSYWRRRVIALAAGLGLAGLLGWAFSGGGKPVTPAPRTSQAAGLRPAVAYSGPPSSPAGATSPAGPAAPGAVTGRSPVSGLPSPRSEGGQPTASASASGQAGAAGTTGAAGAAGTAGGCSPQAVVLSLFTSRAEYYGGQDPEFDLYAVSTASGDCPFDTGQKKLQVVVMSSGRIIWDSADCARGGGSRVAELRRGVPAQETVSWNRTISLPGCVTLASGARPGTYQVQARTATVASPVLTFKLAH